MIKERPHHARNAVYDEPLCVTRIWYGILFSGEYSCILSTHDTLTHLHDLTSPFLPLGVPVPRTISGTLYTSVSEALYMSLDPHSTGFFTPITNLLASTRKQEFIATMYRLTRQLRIPRSVCARRRELEKQVSSTNEKQKKQCERHVTREPRERPRFNRV